MEYNKYFTPDNQINILEDEALYKNAFHLTITFSNFTNLDLYFEKLNKVFAVYTYKYYAWYCYTKDKPNNGHRKKKHVHLILLSDSNFMNYDLLNKIGKYNNHFSLINVDETINVLDYIHDGHHIIHDKYYFSNINDKSFREILRDLRVDSNR